MKKSVKQLFTFVLLFITAVVGLFVSTKAISAANASGNYTNWMLDFDYEKFVPINSLSTPESVVSSGFSVRFNYLPGGHMTMGKYSLYRLENGQQIPIVENQGIANEEDAVRYDLTGNFLLRGDSYQYNDELGEWVKFGPICNYQFTVLNQFTDYTNWNIQYDGGSTAIGINTPSVRVVSNGFSIYFNYMLGGHSNGGRYTLYRVVNGMLVKELEGGLPNEDMPLKIDLVGTFVLQGRSVTFNGQEWEYFGNDCNYQFTIVDPQVSNFEVFTDPESVGTEVILNGGAKYGTVITQGFTRLLFMGPTAPSQSRLAYDFAVSDKNVLSVSDYGTILAKAPGSATITVTYKANPSKVAYIKIVVIADSSHEVKPVQVTTDKREDPQFNGTEVQEGLGMPGETSIHVGYTRSICIISNGPSRLIQDYIWTSSDSSIATVSQFGTVLGISSGTVMITGVYKYNSNYVCAIAFVII